MSKAIARLNAELEGRYRVLREIGSGGMATVYLAEDLKHGRDVAVKVLRPGVEAAFRRDLDLLVPANRALEAQALLEGTGCAAPAWARGDGLEDRHHLAPLVAPGGGFAIEVHHTLAPQDWDGARVLADPNSQHSKQASMTVRAMRNPTGIPPCRTKQASLVFAFGESIW